MKKLSRKISHNNHHTNNRQVGTPLTPLRIELLESRTLLSVEPIANAAVNNGDDTACIVVAAPSERQDENTPICVDAVVLSNAVENSDVVASCVASEQWRALQEVFENYEDDLSSEVDESFIVETIDFDAETVDDSTLTLEGGTRSGGSGGSDSGGGDGSPITPHFSGDGIEYNGGYLINEGTDFAITFTGGTVGDVVSATINAGDTGAGDLVVVSSSATIGGNPGNSTIQITVVQDNDFYELDETFTVSLAITNGSSTLTLTSFTFTIVWIPEFDSLTDSNLSQIEKNNDYYRACLDWDSCGGTELTYYCKTIGVFGGVANNANRVEYSIIQNSNSPTDPANFFMIDPDTGVISLKNTEISYIAATEGNYECDLPIKVENISYIGISGGAPADEAIVHITFSHWDVYRYNDAELADAFPSEGASISLLARTIGLLPNEFLDWLTIEENPCSPYLQLYDCTIKRYDEILPADKLCPNYEYPIFYVPNTIFAAYCFDRRVQNTTVNGANVFWQRSIDDFKMLGFYVETFENYKLLNDNGRDGSSNETNLSDVYKMAFSVSIFDKSFDKKLHGIYMIGHGDNDYFYTYDPEGNTSNINDYGPMWKIRYVSGSTPTSNNPDDLQDWAISDMLIYHLGSVIIDACYSQINGSKLCSTSVIPYSGGISLCFSGINNTYRNRWAVHWTIELGYEDYNNVGGAQGTNRFFIPGLNNPNY